MFVQGKAVLKAKATRSLIYGSLEEELSMMLALH